MKSFGKIRERRVGCGYAAIGVGGQSRQAGNVAAITAPAARVGPPGDIHKWARFNCTLQGSAINLLIYARARYERDDFIPARA
jgi:hypothetical protein